MNLKTVALTVLIFTAVVLAAACAGEQTRSAFDPVNKTNDGFALRGYDAVAYFTTQNAVEGDKRFEYMWNGAKWLFSSVENLERFRSDPAAYAPQFGGYCSYAVSNGYTANGDPQAWKIVNGKLYLNYDQDVKKMWEQEQDERIKKGDKNWEQFKVKKPEHKG